MKPLFKTQLELVSSYAKVSCEPGWKWERTQDPMDDFDLWYVWEGKGQVIHNGTAYAVSRGSCFLFKPQDTVVASQQIDHPLTVTYIHFDSNNEALIDYPDYIQFIKTSYIEVYLTRYIQLLISQEDAYEEEAKLLLSLMLTTMKKQKNPPHINKESELAQVLWDVAAYIRQHPGEIHSIDDLARRAHLSKRYFSLKFKEMIGQTVESYVIETRIDRAAYLLQFGGMSVGEVADLLGYQSIYFFSRQFKKYKGFPPSRI